MTTNGEHHETREIGGKSYTFRKLTRRDWNALADKCWQEKRSQLGLDIKAIMALGFSQAQVPMVVAEFTKRPTEMEMVRWIDSPRGVDEVLAASAGVPVDEVKGWPASGLDYVEIVVGVCGFGRGAEVAPDRAPLSPTSTAVTAT